MDNWVHGLVIGGWMDACMGSRQVSMGSRQVSRWVDGWLMGRQVDRHKVNEATASRSTQQHRPPSKT